MRLSPSLFHATIQEARDLIAEFEDTRAHALAEDDHQYVAILDDVIATLRRGVQDAVEDYTPELNLN